MMSRLGVPSIISSGTDISLVKFSLSPIIPCHESQKTTRTCFLPPVMATYANGSSFRASPQVELYAYLSLISLSEEVNFEIQGKA